jgi:DNA-binding HxlR family transcriptional regulator
LLRAQLWLSGGFAARCGIHLPKLIRKIEICGVTCEMQVSVCYCGKMRAKKKDGGKWRSGCPLNASVEILGDRWSLLIIRDMMLRGFRTYKEFLGSDEGIATNILAERLRRLEAHGIICSMAEPSDGRKLIYVLTEKGIDLAPVLTEMVLWAAAHEDTGNAALVRLMQKDRGQFLAELRERWASKAVRRAGR